MRTWLNGVAFGLGSAFLEIVLVYSISVIRIAITVPQMGSLLDMLADPVERNMVVLIHIASTLKEDDGNTMSNLLHS